MWASAVRTPSVRIAVRVVAMPDPVRVGLDAERQLVVGLLGGG